MNTTIRRFLLPAASLLIIFLSLALLLRPSPVRASTSGVVISQVYGGGGNSGATFKNDFIEVFNAGSTTANLSGWSVQYASAAGTTWQVTNLSGTLAPGQYFLVQEAQGAGGTTALPTPNATGTIAMSATSGKVALVSSTTALSGGCPVGGNIVDFVGYGTGTNAPSCFEGTAGAPTLTNTTADLRRGNGAQDTDNNSADFTAGAPNPRNSTALGANPTGVGSASPSSVNQGASTLLTVSVTPGTSPASTGISVTANLSTIGGAASQTFFDDGTNGDVTPGNNVFSFNATVGGAVSTGPKTLPVTISDAQGRSSTTSISLTVTAPPLQLMIHDIQGTTQVSPFAGKFVTTTGIVTAHTSNGFFIQLPDSGVDNDPNTPEGIFVFTSSAPPAAATVGNFVQVTGTVAEFVPSTDPNSPPSTEIGGSPTVLLLSTGNPLPAPVVLTAADTNPAGGITQLQKYKAMRVHVDALNTTAPTSGSVQEASATATSNGVFFGVLTGIARPFREPGIEVPDPLPAGAPANVPRFDANPELIRVDSRSLTGSTILDVTSGATVTQLTGPLDYSNRFYTILTDPGSGAQVSGNVSATPVPVPAPNELTIANFNMERFFDTTDDPGVSDVALTPQAFANRLNKASLAIRNVLNSPDIIGVEEMENLSTLQAVADKVNADALAAGQPSPNYHPYLVEGNDVGGIDVGFLVKDRVNVISVQQVGKDATFLAPGSTTPALLNDRPPLVLMATVSQTGSDVPLPVTVVVNHLRSLLSVDDPVDGPRVRAKRQAQAEFLANLLQSHQAAGENVVQVCDCNAFEFNDGYVDMVGTLLGSPTPLDQVVNASPDLVDPNFTDLLFTLPHEQQYSYVENGSAQTLDHILVSASMLSRLTRFAIARNDADFPQVYRNDPNRPERISDHDMPVAYFSLPEPTPPPVLSLPSSVTAEATSANGATVSYTAKANDPNDGPITPVCTPASGSQFALGSTQVNCSATNSHNKTASGSFSIIVVDTTPPTIQCGAPDGLWHGSDVSITCTATDSVSGLANPADASFSLTTTVAPNTETTNASTGTRQVCDAAGNCSTAGPISGIQVDKKAPVITAGATVNGNPYAPGTWTNQTVVVTFACTDGGSGVATVTSPVSVNSEGANQSVNGSCTDQVGNSANSSFSGINIDRTPPNAPGISAAPPANGSGWNNTNVTVSFLSNGDAGPVQSGVNNCTAPVVLNSETSAAAVSGVCTDFAGNVSATASTTIRIDKTAPSVSVQGVTNGATYLLGQAPTPHCSTTDALSGVATQASLTVTGGNSHGVGHFTATCSGATDRAGNITPPVSVSYNIGYVFNFTRLGPGNNVINSGDHADVRWQISDGSGNMIVRLDAVRSILVAPNSTCTAGGEGAPFNPTPKDNPALRFDGAAYRFRWDTAGIPVPACYSFMVGLDDESVHTVIFQLEKAH